MVASRQSTKARPATYIALQRVKYASDSSFLAVRINSRVRRSTGQKPALSVPRDTESTCFYGQIPVAEPTNRTVASARALVGDALTLYREDTGST